jgi:CMP-N-acetylneuraminic acid synthetase|tara:strand:+ start:8381 stop:8965 length:585 start_codon:yes stop_codon:yes gene_type:complete
VKIVTIIPARGGSKRLPRKALYPVNGVPMIKKVLDETKKSKYVNRIVVSTEDNEIKDLCVQNKIEVQDRPLELSDDHTEKMDVIEYTVKKLIDNGYEPDIVISLQSNSPEFKGTDLDKGIEFFLEELYNDHPICEVMSINPDMLQNGCFRIMTTKTVFQKTLSIHVGVYMTDYIDVHNIEDVGKVEGRLLNERN